MALAKDFGSVRTFEAGATVGPHKGDIWGLGLMMRGMIWVSSVLVFFYFYVFSTLGYP